MTSPDVPLTPHISVEHAVLYHGKPVAIREDYDEAVWALHEHMRSHGLNREDLHIGFRMTITAHTHWQPVTKDTDYDTLITTMLPAGTLIHIP